MSTRPSLPVQYGFEPDLPVDEFVNVLERSTLAERRPVHDRDWMEQMLRGSSLIATARQEGRLVGVARSLTDFSYCIYLADLAVDVACQGLGIGKELIHRSHAAAGPGTMLILLAAPKAESYYPHVGLIEHHSCWTLPRSKT